MDRTTKSVKTIALLFSALLTAMIQVFYASIKTPGRVHESFAMIFTSHHLSVSNYYPLPFPIIVNY